MSAGRPSVLLIAWSSAILCLAVLAAGIPGVAPALADGDPASDVLLGANVFYPYSPPVSTGLQQALNAETAAAARKNFPIKVALIASPSDLGAIPVLFGKPQQYAGFLDQEISFTSRELLLVVMPTGYGVAGLTPPAAAAVGSLAKPGGAASDYLAQAAIAAVPKLAAAAGHPIGPVGAASATGHSHGLPVLPLVGLGVLAVATATAVILLRRRS